MAKNKNEAVNPSSKALITTKASAASADQKQQLEAAAPSSAPQSATQQLLASLAPRVQRDPQLVAQLELHRAAYRAVEACCMAKVRWVESEATMQLPQIPERTPREMARVLSRSWKLAIPAIKKLPLDLQQRVLIAQHEDSGLAATSLLRTRAMRELFQNCFHAEHPNFSELEGQLVELFTLDKGSYPALFSYFEYGATLIKDRVLELERLMRGEPPRARLASASAIVVQAGAVAMASPSTPQLAASTGTGSPAAINTDDWNESDFKVLDVLEKKEVGMTAKRIVQVLNDYTEGTIQRAIRRLRKRGFKISNKRGRRGYVLKEYPQPRAEPIGVRAGA